jgi:hypothetical protein
VPDLFLELCNARRSTRAASWLRSLATIAGQDGHELCSNVCFEVRAEARAMLDLMLIAVTVAFFVVAVLYVHACDRM